MTNEQKIDWINEHRFALGYDQFDAMSEAEIEHHMALIETNAPYGNDPWRTK